MQANQGNKQINQSIYCVILAGGNGQRLWPLSRQSLPKQLLTIDGNKTLLEHAIDRAQRVVCRKNVWINTIKKYEKIIANLTKNKIGKIEIRPLTVETAFAMLLSCLEIYKKDPEAIVIFMTSDSFIAKKDTLLFSKCIKKAIALAIQKNQIILLGSKPTYAAINYGYIKIESKKASHSIKKFYHNVTQKWVRRFFQEKNMLWFTGIFCSKVSVLINVFKLEDIELFEQVSDYLNNKIVSENIKLIHDVIMKNPKHFSIVITDYQWFDIGNVETFLFLKNNLGILNKNKVIEIEATNNLVDVPNKLVALVGVNDLCVVETEQVLLITKRDDAEKVREIVKRNKQKGFERYL